MPRKQGRRDPHDRGVIDMRVLITNFYMGNRSGTVQYVRDLALELTRRGHAAAVYTWQRGPVCTELEASGIQVIETPRRCRFSPDIVHAHHYPITLAALRSFATIPGIFVCHDHLPSWAWDRSPNHPRIRRYYGVSALCVDRLRMEGAPADRTLLLPNFVDLTRFRPRPPLPAHPRRALVFSNYAHARTHLPVIAEACRLVGLDLDVIGEGAGRASIRPEETLGRYDIVFAKAKAAIEAMAVGAAVVLCDSDGAGPMVTSDGLDELRSVNFGFEALREPLRPTSLLPQIARYDAEDAARVRDRIRATAGLDRAIERLIGIYEEVIGEYSGRPATTPPTEPCLSPPSLARHYLSAKAFAHWQEVSPDRRNTFLTFLGMGAIRSWGRGLLRGR